MADEDNRTSEFLSHAPTNVLLDILETQRGKKSSTNDKGCLISGLKPQQHGYCQASIPPNIVAKYLGEAGNQLKISLHQIACIVMNGPRPPKNDAHHRCRVRGCFRWTPDDEGRNHIAWVPEDIHKTIMCPIKLTIDVKCNQCDGMIHINVCIDPIPQPHGGPSCF